MLGQGGNIFSKSQSPLEPGGNLTTMRTTQRQWESGGKFKTAAVGVGGTGSSGPSPALAHPREKDNIIDQGETGPESTGWAGMKPLADLGTELDLLPPLKDRRNPTP